MANITGTASNDVIIFGSVTAGVTGGAPGNAADSILGLGGDDVLGGWEGADTLRGGEGRDSLYGDQGGDLLDLGTDTLGGLVKEDFQAGDGADTILGSNGADVVIAHLGNDSVDGRGGGDFLGVSTGNDAVLGGAGNDTLLGEEGFDSLNGGTEDDWLQDHRQWVYGEWANAEADTLLGGAGNDTLDTGGGADSLDGGAGVDLLRILLPLPAAPIVVVLGSAGGPTQASVGGLSMTVTGVEALRIEAGSASDLLDAGAGTEADSLLGGAGNDTVRGGGGGDTLAGEDGVDSLAGGAGEDWMFGDSGGDTLRGDDGNDRLSGLGDGDRLSGGGGDDLAEGGEGDDTLFGNGGNDTLVAGDGVIGYSLEALHGGGGNDLLSAVDSANSILRDDSLYGGAGNDTLRARDSGRLWGEDGNDLIEFSPSLAFSAGRYTFEIDGGAGVDTVVLSPSPTQNFNYALFVDENGDGTVDAQDAMPTVENPLSQFGALRGIEAVSFGVGTDLVGDEFLRAGTGDDTLVAGQGRDTLDGGAGDDLLDGGRDVDRVFGGAGNDTIACSEGMGRGGDGDDVLEASFRDEGRALTLAGEAGNDRIAGFGEGNGEVLQGGSGDDTITAAIGTQYADGGDGIDLLVLNAGGFGAAAMRLDAFGDGSGYADAGGGTIDFDGIERIQATGGGQGDTLAGASGADTLVGEGGSDSLAGGGAADSLDGGVNADTLSGGAGNDTLAGRDGGDRIILGTGADALRYVFANGEGGDTITDFAPADDAIQVSAAGFGGGLVAGALPAARFVANTTGQAAAALGQFTWETDASRLWWDADGTGAGARVLLGTFLGAPALTAADIVVIA